MKKKVPGDLCGVLFMHTYTVNQNFHYFGYFISLFSSDRTIPFFSYILLVEKGEGEMG